MIPDDGFGISCLEGGVANGPEHGDAHRDERVAEHVMGAPELLGDRIAKWSMEWGSMAANGYAFSQAARFGSIVTSYFIRTLDTSGSIRMEPVSRRMCSGRSLAISQSHRLGRMPTNRHWAKNSTRFPSRRFRRGP